MLILGGLSARASEARGTSFRGGAHFHPSTPRERCWPRPKIDVAEDLVPIGEFKTHASKLLRKLHETGRPLVITQNGKASAVVLTPDEFEQLGYRQYVGQKIKAGERSSETKTFSTQQVAQNLKKRIRAKASEG